MKKQVLGITFLILITFLFCLVILLFLPAQIPIHRNTEGVIDNWYDKLFPFLFPVLQLVITVGFQFVRGTGPCRENVECLVSTCNVFLMVLCLFIFDMCLITAISAWRPGASGVPMAITPGLGSLSTIMGNLMPKIHQSYFIGIRAPQALEDGDNWRRTHRVAGRLWLVAGPLIMLLSVLPKEVLTGSILGLASATALISYIYSYSLFYSKRMKGESKRLKLSM